MWKEKARPNKTAKVPYAYKPSDIDVLILISDQAKTDLVEQAMDHLDQGHSSRKVAAWLTEKTGQKISHQGITNIWKEHRGLTLIIPPNFSKNGKKHERKLHLKGDMPRR